jgi:hypothetical protein
MVPDSVRRRVDFPKRLVVRARTIRDSRHETVRRSADLEKRMGNLERLVAFLTNMVLGLVSACFAIAGAVCVAGGFYWEESISSAVLAFFIAMWLSDFLFPKARRWCLE